MVMLLIISLLLYFLEVCCPVPDVDHISITYRKKNQSANHCTYYSGDKISYTCNNNEKVRYVSSCSEQGTWRPRMPVCDRGKSLQTHIILEVFFMSKWWKLLLFLIEVHWCTILYKFHVYSIVIHNFERLYSIYSYKNWLYSLYCTVYPCGLFISYIVVCTS